MGKFIGIAIIAFVIIFVIQQSRVFETEKVYDVRLGIAKEETHIKWDNMAKYFEDIAGNVKKMMKRK